MKLWLKYFSTSFLFVVIFFCHFLFEQNNLVIGKKANSNKSNLFRTSKVTISQAVWLANEYICRNWYFKFILLLKYLEKSKYIPSRVSLKLFIDESKLILKNKTNSFLNKQKTTNSNIIEYLTNSLTNHRGLVLVLYFTVYHIELNPCDLPPRGQSYDFLADGPGWP